MMHFMYHLDLDFGQRYYRFRQDSIDSYFPKCRKKQDKEYSMSIILQNEDEQIKKYIVKNKYISILNSDK